MTRPKKPIDNLPRVYRGGSWNSTTATLVRAAFRDGSTPSVRCNSLGFRCVLRGRYPVGKGST